MRVPLLVAAALLVAFVAAPADARHNWATLRLEARDVEDPETIALRIIANFSFGFDGYHCRSDRLYGHGTLQLGEGEPKPIEFSGCWGHGVGLTSYMDITGWSEQGWFTFLLGGPTDALAGYGYGWDSRDDFVAHGSVSWGLQEDLGMHEDDPIPDWVPVRPPG